MITEERIPVRGHMPPRPPAGELDPAPRSARDEPLRRPSPEAAGRSILWRLILAFIGAGIAVTGWLLILTVFFSFIGLPLFILGLAVMQSQER